ncbi:hypothetical protein AB0G74_22560 [Streptomyces sp. NPDC020875]|uniref:hypothetical protein n=1 Tax=Streptomyces sp. NPDC020875 TaxID=3154898 RepID=UPI0033EFF94D
MASERDTALRPSRRHRPPQPPSMRDLLASCAAATAVSTPPRLHDETGHDHTYDHERDYDGTGGAAHAEPGTRADGNRPPVHRDAA